MLPREKETKKPWVSTQSSDLIEQRQSAWKRYQNHRNSENYNTWRNIAGLADASLANDKIKKIEQMCVAADAASKRNDTKEHSPTTSPSSVNKRNGEPATSFIELLEEWTEYFKELLNANATNTLTKYQLRSTILTSIQKTSLSKKFPRLSKALKLVNQLVMIIM